MTYVDDKQRRPVWRVRVRDSIRTRFALAFVSLFVIVIAITGLVSTVGLPFTSFDGWVGNARREAVNDLNLLADLNRDQLLQWFNERFGDIQVMAGNETTKANLAALVALSRQADLADQDEPRFRQQLADSDGFRILRSNLAGFRNAYESNRDAVYEVIHIVDVVNHRILVSTREEETGGVYSAAIMIPPGKVQQERDNLAYIFAQADNSSPMLHLAHAVFDAGGSVMAVVVAEIALATAFPSMHHVQIDLGDSGEALLVDGSARLLTPLRFPLSDGSRARLLEYKFTTEPASLAASGGNGTIEAEDYRGQQVVAAYRHFPISRDLALGLVVKVDKSQLFAPVQKSVRFSILIGAIGLFFMMLVSLVLTSQLTRPVRRMAMTASRFADGERKARTNFRSNDEIGLLSAAFDAMADKVETTWLELEQRSEELDAANKELESFGYSVAHDLRAPLRAINGFSQALLEDYGDKLEGQAREYLGYVCEGSEEMGRLIDDLLKLSRATRGEMTREDVDLSRLATQIIDNLKASEPERDVRVDIAPGVMARGDQRLLRVVMENLLGNAWKFSRLKPQAHIEFFAEDLNGRIRYTVRDNGVGFDMAYRDKLFQPFNRLHRQDQFDGTGIGLVTAYRIIKRHHGSLQAEGHVGEGASFSFELNKEGVTNRSKGESG